MNAARFHNMLRTMWNLDRHDLVEHGVIDADDLSTWKAFRDYPHNTALRLPDERFDRLFVLIESRQRHYRHRRQATRHEGDAHRRKTRIRRGHSPAVVVGCASVFGTDSMTKIGNAVALPSEMRNERAKKRLKRRETPVMDSAELVGLIERLHWYALRTPAQKEYIAQEVLTRKGFVTYYPTDKRWRRRNRFQKEKQLIGYAMIPRTLFVGFEPGIPLWFNIFSLPAVSSVIGINGRPMRLDNKGMANLITKFANGIQRPDEEKHMQTGKEFAAGDMVRVINGPFNGMKVPVHDVRGKEAVVFMELFGGRHEITISTWNLEAAA